MTEIPREKEEGKEEGTEFIIADDGPPAVPEPDPIIRKIVRSKPIKQEKSSLGKALVRARESLKKNPLRRRKDLE